MTDTHVNFRFVEFGGKMRPFCYNFNAQSEFESIIKSQMGDTTQLETALRQRMETLDRDLTPEEIQEIAVKHNGTVDTKYVRTLFYIMLQEGARKASYDMTIPRTVYVPGDDGIPVEKVKGTRDITVEDVGDWIDEADSDTIERIMKLQEQYQISQEQRKNLKRHETRAQNSDESLDVDDTVKN